MKDSELWFRSGYIRSTLDGTRERSALTAVYSQYFEHWRQAARAEARAAEKDAKEAAVDGRLPGFVFFPPVGFLFEAPEGWIVPIPMNIDINFPWFGFSKPND
jgi:hypothetical protein